MEKRFQVFISSTYADLKDERQRVIQTVMEMDCIPAGMELFPAADEEQLQFIKSVIDDCDYYLLIVGGRYGSLTSEGISYTEQEFEYAISIGLKVLVFLHERPEEIPVGKSEVEPELCRKLAEFREKASTSRLVKFWTRADELPGLVALSLSKTIKLYPAVGWVRADSLANKETLTELIALQRSNDSLRKELATFETTDVEESLNLAGLDEEFVLRLQWRTSGQYGKDYTEEVEDTWRNFFSEIGPSLIEHPTNSAVNGGLAKSVYCRHHDTIKPPYNVRIFEKDFETVRLQLEALGLVSVNYSKTTKGNRALFWTLSPAGQQLITQLRTVKSKD